jgi:hypothetical protein
VFNIDDGNCPDMIEVRAHNDYTGPNSDVELGGNQDKSFVSEGHNLVVSGGGATAFSAARNDWVGIHDPSLLPLARN